ncbi:MAG: hypothetical protein CSA62_00520 [Planctomycetota bacterium]|nr:MAG: hypothetical protein CSA62_00520 [Planctomycetota bacterium]
MADPQILLLAPEGPEREALLAGLQPRQELKPRTALPQDLGPVDLVWFHRAPDEELGELESGDAERLAKWVRGGGRLLLTGSPAQWTGLLGFESQPPSIRRRRWEGPLRAQDRLGVAGFGGHPLFRRHRGGVYLRRPWGGCAMGGALYVAGARPVEGRLLGVEKVFLGLDAETGLLVEHLPGEGRVLSLGAHLVFAHAGPGEDPFVENRLRFAVDLIDELLTGDIADEAVIAGRSWPPRAELLREAEAPDFSLPSAWPFADLEALRAEKEPLIAIPGEYDSFDLPSRAGVLALGTGAAGLREVWRLPVRLLSGLDLLDEEDAPPTPVRLLLRPSSVERELAFGETRLSEVLVSPEASGVLAGELHGGSGRIRLLFHGDHRMQWPYPPRALACIENSMSEAGRLFQFADSTLGHTGLLAFSQEPLSYCCEPEADGFVARFDFELRPEQALSWVLASGVSRDEALDSLKNCLSEGGPLGAAALEHRAQRRQTRLAISTGNAELDHELSWCVEKGDEFFVETRAHEGAEPLRGYVGGYGVTRPGWCSGRPGYAWFFGRDSLWFARAMLAFGDREDVRDNLRLLARGQGPSGEIYHEWTPSGVVHYDAADATPMFVELLGRYVDWTGDLALGKELFGQVERALAFLEDRDRDGDGVTENSGVGHAWVEDGPLSEQVHAECYLASAQAAALLRGSALAQRLGKDALSRDWRAQAATVQRVLSERFFDEDLGRFAHALRRDGSFDLSPSALGAMPAVFGVIDENLAGRSLVPYAGSEYSTDWGVRLLSEEDPRFDPISFQAGSVWPLLTGWVTLADFQVGRPGPAWERLTGLLGLVTRFHPGVLEEVYRGDLCAPMGLCPHQAWSHSAVFGALALGLLGLGVEAGTDVLRIAPCLPGGLDELRAERVRFRDAQLHVQVHREQDGRHLEIVLEGVEGNCAVELAPFFPSPCEIQEVQIDGEALDCEREELLEGLRLRSPSFEVAAGQRRVLRFDVVPDLLIVDRTVRPEEEQGSEAPRVLARRALDGNSALELVVEARPGHHSLPVRLPGRPPLSIEGAELRSGSLRFHIEEKSPSASYTRHTMIRHTMILRFQ